MPTAAEMIVGGIGQRFHTGGYKVFQNVPLPNGPMAALTASRTYFSWKGLIIFSQHVIVRQMDNARLPDIQDLFEAGFRYGKQVNKVPLPRGFQFGYMIIPVIVGADAEVAMVQYACASPRKHWSLFEFPVFVDTRTGQTYCFSGTAAWGAFFYSDMRRLVHEFITPR
jgi:hypothetical protein